MFVVRSSVGAKKVDNNELKSSRPVGVPIPLQLLVVMATHAQLGPDPIDHRRCIRTRSSAKKGGAIVETYQWDTTERKADSVVCTGTASTFHGLGFEIVQRRAPHKPT